MKPDATIIKEIEEQRPRCPVGLLSRGEKDRLIERGLTGLYRWYLARSQATRNWNPDKTFNWRDFHTNHSQDLCCILEGFYAVENYAPDYVSKMLLVIRRSYGRSHFQLLWGSEEQKHMESWLNTLYYARSRTPAWIEDYKTSLRAQEWNMPWDSPMHTLFYTLIQERATQINYLHTAIIARGGNDRPQFANDQDPVLDHVCRVIAMDEAAHYNFFLEASRLFFYYYPAQALEALLDVISHFAMPARDIIPNFREFEEVVARAGVFSPREYLSDVLQVVLKNLSTRGLGAVVNGVRRSRRVPDPDGNMRDTALFEALDYEAVQAAVRRLHGRIEEYERHTGRAAIDATHFVPSGLDAKNGQTSQDFVTV